MDFNLQKELHLAKHLYISFVLDKSGSMLPRRPATIEAFNAYIGGLKEDFERNGGEPIFFSLTQFDSEAIEETVVEQPIGRVPQLSNQNYVPRGGTPLIDAAYNAIRKAERYKVRNPDARVVICIQTDGHENNSRHHSWEALRELVSEKQREDWQFNFMGAGIDAYDQASKLGLSTSSTISYGDSVENTRAVFAATAQNLGTFRSYASADVSYTAGQKFAAGDKYDPDLKKAQKKPEAQSQQ